jgi:hypothetical protein
MGMWKNALRFQPDEFLRIDTTPKPRRSESQLMTPEQPSLPKRTITRAKALLQSFFEVRDFVNEAQAQKWAQVAPFGDFDNTSGLQRFRPEDARTIANEFRSMANIPQRVLGLPWYIGHPDYPPMKDRYTDTKAYGRIRELDVREDANCQACKVGKGCPTHGLFANVDWSEDGNRLVAAKAFHGHSVNWRMRREGSVWRPFSIKSVGFTNEPQIPVVPVTAVNEHETERDGIAYFANEGTTMKKLTDYIKAWLGKKPEDNTCEDDLVNECDAKVKSMANEMAALKQAKATADGECTAAKDKMAANETTLRAALKAAGVELAAGADVIATFVNEFAKSEPLLKAAAKKITEIEATFTNERTALTTRATTAETALAEAKGKATKLEVDFANERKEHVKLVLDDGITRGVITQADRAQWEKDFANETGFTDALGRFAKLPKKLKTESIVSRRDLGTRNSDARKRQSEVIDAVNETMRAEKCDYDSAFEKVKKAKPALFEGMKKPETATA